MIDRIPFAARPAVFFGVVLASYFWAADPTRIVEARVVAQIGGMLSDRVVGLGDSASVLVRADGSFFAAELTRSCSSSVAAATLFGVGMLFTTGSTTTRLRAVATAISFVVVVNILRITFVMVLGASHGPEVLALAHDLAGTMISYLALALGLTILVRHSLREDRKTKTSLTPWRIR